MQIDRTVIQFFGKANRSVFLGTFIEQFGSHIGLTVFCIAQMPRIGKDKLHRNNGQRLAVFKNNRYLSLFIIQFLYGLCHECSLQ